ncbi:hypothetical protein E2562_003169 [Oryza meyeriana var. granulata]|uniref:Uncharacterized protein n=1 Tax=Oryza meyeriana var. granulata TaxID=110450 RepID=A0A6G1CLF7_9ORYZ|nr:hypothetical protein E2562_036706 [Oryza meyeriana var. granulata]KAF0928347.1 hypothetical protein E2562_003169 [Oryza meyeriana var. granulata]
MEEDPNSQVAFIAVSSTPAHGKYITNALGHLSLSPKAQRSQASLESLEEPSLEVLLDRMLKAADLVDGLVDELTSSAPLEDQVVSTTVQDFGPIVATPLGHGLPA